MVFKDLPIIQRIFNTKEKSSTGVSPADLVLTNAIHMQTNLYSPTDSAKAIETSTPIKEVLDKMTTVDFAQSSSKDSVCARFTPHRTTRS